MLVHLGRRALPDFISNNPWCTVFDVLCIVSGVTSKPSPPCQVRISVVSVGVSTLASVGAVGKRSPGYQLQVFSGLS